MINFAKILFFSKKIILKSQEIKHALTQNYLQITVLNKDWILASLNL